MNHSRGTFLGRSARNLVLVFFFLSGASALTYEILWTRQLILVAGATTPAVSLVLAVFMGGLALGSWVFGRVADRSPHLLRWYAGLELGIGLFALLQPHFVSKLTPLYLHLLPGQAAHGPAVLFLRLLLAVVLLLIPTTLMGGTLPILLRFVARSRDRFGRDLGHLYAANLAGAMAGAALTGFMLVRILGLGGTLLWAVALNTGIAMLALLLSWSPETLATGAGDEADGSRPERLAPTGTPFLRGLLWGAVAASGFLTMGYEVVWTRMLVITFQSTVYSFTLILVVFLLGLSLGSLLFARIERRPDGLFDLSRCLLASALLSLALTPLVRHFPAWLTSASSRFGYSGTVQLAFTAVCSGLVMLLPTVFMGVVFPLASRLLIDRLDTAGRRIGTAYWVNTLGAIAGSLAAGFLLIPFLSVKGCLLALAVAQALLGFLLLGWGNRERLRFVWGTAAIVVLSLAGVVYSRSLPGPSPFDDFDSPIGMATLVEAHHDDPAGSVSVASRSDGVKMLRINGFLATTDAAQASYMPMMSHIPILLHGRAQHVLVICIGTGATAGSALLHSGVEVDAVDINPTVVSFLPHFARANHGLDHDPRAHIFVDDGRNFLMTTGRKYDVITMEPMPPNHAGVVNLYSREYYALAKERLNPGGLLVQWLPPHLVAGDEARGILRSVQDVFPETTLWIYSNTGLIVARKGAPIRIDLPALAHAYEDPALAGELARLHVPTPLSLVSLFALGPEGVRRFVGDTPPVTDDRPSLEFHIPRHSRALLLGGTYSQDFLEVMDRIYACRALETVPVDGLPAAALPDLQHSFRMQSYYQQGAIWMEAGVARAAERPFIEGLAQARTSTDRGQFLYFLALSALAQGQRSNAAALVARSLQEFPDNPGPLGLQRSMAAK